MKPAHAIAAALLFTAAPCFAFELKRDSTGEVVRWAHAVQFVVDEGLARSLGEPAAIDAVQAAAAEFSASGGIQVTAQAGKAVSGVGYDFAAQAANQNEIVGLADWEFDPNAIAVTVVTVDSKSHAIIDADIALNIHSRKFRALPSQASAAGVFDDIQNTITHELGHALGLAHNPDEPGAVMFPGARRGEVTKRVLSADDLAGLTELYGAGSSGTLVASATEQAAGCSAVAGVPGWLPIVAMGLMMLWRKRTFGLVLACAAATTVSAAERRLAPVIEAEQAVKAVVISRRALPPEPGVKLLRTELRLKTTDCLKGVCSEEWVLVVPGGRHGGFEQTVEGLTVPEAGEQVAFTVAPGERTARPAPSRVRLFRLKLATDTLAFIEGLAKAHRSTSPQR